MSPRDGAYIHGELLFILLIGKFGPKKLLHFIGL